MINEINIWDYDDKFLHVLLKYKVFHFVVIIVFIRHIVGVFQDNGGDVRQGRGK